MKTIMEPARNIPIAEQADICILGGSCTGVFAAVRAARLGARVVLIEKQNSFGGMATTGLVNTWPSLYDTEKKQKIVAGLTQEILDRLAKRNAVAIDGEKLERYSFNSEELKIELDELVMEAGIKPFLHTSYTAPHVVGDQVEAVILENKSGRFAVKADYFIDATGDGDLCAHLGSAYTRTGSLQPPSTGVKLYGMDRLGYRQFLDLIREHGAEFGLKKDRGWGNARVCVPGVTFHAETHVFDTDCADGYQLTAAEIEGRRQIRAMMDIVRQYKSADAIQLVALGAHIGIRETRHARCRYQLTEEDVLSGKRFDDAIANGSRHVDLHPNDRPGMLFKYLDGRQLFTSSEGRQEGRWRPETATNPTYWQIPFRSLIPEGTGNVITCGRTIDADPGAFGAVRLMVSTNQMGEAAGVAAYLALTCAKRIDGIEAQKLRDTLQQGGSIIL